jgi:hypothetical protein
VPLFRVINRSLSCFRGRTVPAQGGPAATVPVAVESSERQQLAPPMLYRVMRVTATCGSLALRLN